VGTRNLELTIREESVLHMAVVQRMEEIKERLEILKSAHHTKVIENMKDDLETLRKLKHKLL